jgi:hypothetical protein
LLSGLFSAPSKPKANGSKTEEPASKITLTINGHGTLIPKAKTQPNLDMSPNLNLARSRGQL